MGSIVGPLLAPLATLGLVMIFTAFILAQRNGCDEQNGNRKPEVAAVRRTVRGTMSRHSAHLFRSDAASEPLLA